MAYAAFGMTNDSRAVDTFNKTVREYAKHVFENFQKQLQDGGKHFASGFNVTWMSRQTHWDWTKDVWDYNASTDCKPCKELFEEVIALHRKKDKIGFENCRKKEVPGCWGIAKLFMPENCQDVGSPEDTDITIILQMMLNCRLFMTFGYDHVEKIIQGQKMFQRYPIFVSDERKEFYDAVTTLLENLRQDETISDNLKAAVSKIKTTAAERPDVPLSPLSTARGLPGNFGGLFGLKF